MRATITTILLLLLAVPSAVYSLEVTETARIQVGDADLLVPAESGWISHSSKRLTVYKDNFEWHHEKRIKGNERIEISDSGNHYGILKYNDHSPTTFSLLRLTVYSSSGEKLYSVEEPRASSIRISNVDGAAVGIVGALGFPSSELDVYSSSGNLAYALQASFLSGIAFEAASGLLLVNSADSGLTAYDNSGMEVHRFGIARNFCVSDDGAFVAASSSAGITYFKNGLKIKSTVEAPGVMGSDIDMRFDSGASKLAVLGIDYLRVYSLPTLELTWELKPPVAGARFSGMDRSDDDMIVVGYDIPEKRNGNTVHTSGGFLLLDFGGAELHRMELEYADWSVGYPLARFSSGGKLLKIASRNEAVLLTISR